MSDTSEKSSDEETVADDILRGATAIGLFLGVTEDKVYYYHKTRKYPIGKLDKLLIASKRQLRRSHRAMTAA